MHLFHERFFCFIKTHEAFLVKQMHGEGRTTFQWEKVCLQLANDVEMTKTLCNPYTDSDFFNSKLRNKRKQSTKSHCMYQCFDCSWNI